MKKLLLVALLATGVSAASHAQGFQRQTPEEQVAALKTQLSLTDAQVAKLTPIYAAQAKSRDSLRTASGDDMQGMFAKMAPITAVYNAKIKAVLDPTQAAAFQKQIDARAEMMKQRMQGN
ncbi:MAG: Spy/CpxP family protein refolding chaperone [Mucilaginibacter sp.]